MSNLIKGKIHDWETVIGLEIHAQVKSNSKLFSSSSTTFGSKPNSQVSLVDAAMPGMLPVINKYCIEQAIKTGIGLSAKINDREAARNFAARHQCDTKNDKTKAGYWACRLPKYAKQLGLKGGGSYFW